MCRGRGSIDVMSATLRSLAVYKAAYSHYRPFADSYLFGLLFIALEALFQKRRDVTLGLVQGLWVPLDPERLWGAAGWA